ncbi:MAG: hypothetical protein QM755_07040 [Luteolibacter sp.]
MPSLERMELTGNWKRWLALAVIVAAFVVSKAWVPPGPMPQKWALLPCFFVGGAVCATVMDHWVGNLDRSNLRWAYVFFGTLVMILGGVCMYVAKAT